MRSGRKEHTRFDALKTSYDILIIGGGMVGASLACAFGDSRLRVGLVEAVRLDAPSQPSYDDRTVALAYGSRRILDGIGVWDRIAAHQIAPILRIHISDRGRFGMTRLSAADLGTEALGYVVENRVLGNALYVSLNGFTGVKLHCPAVLRAVRFEADQAVVDINFDGRTEELSARLIVAADGADSAVRAAAGIAADRTEYDQAAIVTNVTPGKAHGGTAYERFTDTGPLALLPMSEERCAVVWSARRAEVETVLGWTDTEFLARLQDRFGERLGVFQRIGKRRAYPLSLTRVHEHVRPRLVLIGNAAHSVHPVAGQGFNLGLRDVAALAEVLMDAARRGDDIGDLDILRPYAAWRRRDNQVVATLTVGLTRIFSTSFLPLTLARNLGLTAVDLLPPVKRRFMRITSGLAGRLPRLARGLPL